jgi:hypothetical protein
LHSRLIAVLSLFLRVRIVETGRGLLRKN